MSEEPGALPPAPDLPPEAVPEAVPEAAPEAASEIPVEVVAAAPVAAAAAADPTTAIPAAGAPADAAVPPPPTAPVDGSTGGTGGGRNALVIGAVIVAAAIIVGALVVAQGGTSPSPSAAPSVAPTESATAAPTATPEPTPTPAPTPTPNACAPENLATLAAGTLTLGADNPAYPPYFEISDPVTPPWELGDPTNGKGFEGAVAYAVADKLGFAKEQVTWTVVPFNNSFAPGPKPFDFYITQVSWTEERATAVDLSDGYYFVNQAVVAMNGSPLIGVTSIAGLAPFKFGAQVGTTSYDTIVEVIKPTQEPAVFDTNDAAIQALQNGQIDGLVVDLPTAFYVTAAQIVDADFNPLAAIVGQFPPPAEGEFFSLVLAKDGPLTACVNQAIGALKADGTLEAITKEWLADKANAPVFTP
jgi:polar amino acid transport system substrate-binding protein